MKSEIPVSTDFHYTLKSFRQFKEWLAKTLSWQDNKLNLEINK